MRNRLFKEMILLKKKKTKIKKCESQKSKNFQKIKKKE